MFKRLDSFSYFTFSIFAVLILLAPFRPMPHFLEKLQMLKAGRLTRPLDIFDLFFHLAPTLLLIVKTIRGIARQR